MKKKKKTPSSKGASASTTGIEERAETTRRPEAETGHEEVEEEQVAPPERRVDVAPEAREDEPREAASGGGAMPPEVPDAGGDAPMEEAEEATPPPSSTPAEEAEAAEGASASPQWLPAREAPDAGTSSLRSAPAQQDEVEDPVSPPLLTSGAAPEGSVDMEARRGSGAGPSQAMTAEGGADERSGWALQLVSSSAMLKRGTLQGARAALDALETDLQAKEARLADERLRLTEGWRQLDVAIKLGRRQDEAARERCEKAAFDAKEIFESAVREADAADRCHEEAEAHAKVLQEQHAAQVQLLQAREDALAAHEGELASREGELDKRGEALAAREVDAEIRERELARTVGEQTVERECLEMLDRQVAAA